MRAGESCSASASSSPRSWKKLLACARCKAAVYCGKDCQKQAWPTHKKYCRAPSDTAGVGYGAKVSRP